LCTPLSIREEALTWDGIIRCSQSKQNLLIDIAIIGDSHAEQMFIGLAEALPNKNVVFYEQDTLPIIANQKFNRIFKYLISDKHIKTVILNANWNMRKKELPKKSNLYNELLNTINELSNGKKKLSLLMTFQLFLLFPSNVNT